MYIDAGIVQSIQSNEIPQYNCWTDKSKLPLLTLQGDSMHTG